MAQTDEGAPHAPAEERRSFVGRLEPKRAPSRAALFSFCFRLKALPKSKIPTTKTTSNGRATANSSNWDAWVPPRVQSVDLNFLVRWRRTRTSFLLASARRL